MMQPEGFIDQDRVGWVYKLSKALYDLNQASRAWYCTIDTILRDIGFRRADADGTMYGRDTGSRRILILVYVDDILIVGHSGEALQNVARLKSLQVDIS